MSAPTCHGCKQAITDQYANVGEHSFHASCFKCATCSEDLVGKAYVEEAGDYYCENDYYEKFSPKCGHCETAIRGAYMSALDQSWCPDHFLCHQCDAGFPDGQYLKHENKPYCKACYGKVTDSNCAKCGELMDGAVFEANGQRYHRTCFVCVEGNHVLGEDGEFHILADVVYCPKHFTEKFVQKCGVCTKPIHGQFVLMGEKQIHPECWKCQKCQTLLTSETYSKHGGLFYCKPCHPVVVAEEKAREEAEMKRAIEAAKAAGQTAAQAEAAVRAAAEAEAAIKALKMAEDELPCIFFSYDALKDIHNVPDGVAKHRRELYLCDSDFEQILGMSKKDFQAMQQWKKDRAKKKVGLF